MLIRRFYHDGLAQASFLIGCQQTGEALVIDANRDAKSYIAAAESEGVRITHVTETHIHADYLSGSRELAASTGAQLLLSGEGGPDWQYAFSAESSATLLRDGDSFMVGNLRFEVMHAPGHTPEHLVFILTDTPATSRPVGAFTGDFIFVGDVGRPDLLERAASVEGTMRASAAQLFHSIRRFASTYPDYLQIWPGHGAGSACGKALGAVPQTTLGYEKIANWALQIDNVDLFVESVLDGQPDPPVYFATMKRLNREGPALLGSRPAPARVDPSRLSEVIAGGDIVIDVRRTEVVAERFIPGTLNIPATKSFVGWAGWLVAYDRDIYLLADDEDRAHHATRELAMIGLDRVAGWFGPEVFTDWSAHGRPFGSVPQLDAPELASMLEHDNVTVVDVRSAGEWDGGRVAGSRHVPLGRLRDVLPTLPTDRPVVMLCHAGGRSGIASSLARLHGVPNVANLRGGFAAWEQEGLPVERETNAVPA